MIIGVTVDTHNNLKNIENICSLFNENRADLVVHTGDISLPKSLLAFQDLNCPLIAVLGNNDIQEKNRLELAAKDFNCNIFEEPHTLNISDKVISVLHHPDLIDADMIARIDIILHGHTHRFRLESKDGCVIFNPGECAGFMKGKNQIGIFNLKKIQPKIINF